MKKSFIKSMFLGIGFSIGFFFTAFVFIKAASLIATSGTPLTASNWNTMISNFFWGSGSGGIYYNGKVGIGTTSPNKSLHIKTSAGTNAELDIQSGDLPHWAIYQDESTKSLTIRNGVIRTSISTGGNLNAQGLCINGVCKTDWSQVGGGGILNYTGTCDSAHKGASGIISNVYKICDGTIWQTIKSFALGSESNPALSCYNIKQLNSSAIDGVYWLDPNGGSIDDAFKAYCDMTTDGGGWTLLHLYNSATVGTFYSATVFSSDNNVPLSLTGLTGTHNWNKFSSIINSSTILRYTNNKTSLKRYENNINLSSFLSAPTSCSSITVIGGDNNGSKVSTTRNGTFSNVARGNGYAYNALSRGNSCNGNFADAEGLGLRYIMYNSGTGYNPIIGPTTYDFGSNSIVVYVYFK